jgi:hypothetical protein
MATMLLLHTYTPNFLKHLKKSVESGIIRRVRTPDFHRI